MPYDIQNEYAWENDAAFDAALAAQPALPSAASAPGSGGFAAGVSSLFSGIGSVLGSVAQGVGQGLAQRVTSAVNNGRQPGTEVYADPTSSTTGRNLGATATILPGVPNTAVYAGAAVVGLGLLALLMSRR